MTNHEIFHPLPAGLEEIFSTFESDPVKLVEAFMAPFCDHIQADRIFTQPRNPYSRVCKTVRGGEMKVFPGLVTDKWFVEDKWEVEDHLFRAALNLEPSIYVEDIQKAAENGILNLNFENQHMFHTAFIHGHAHWPTLPYEGIKEGPTVQTRQFYGSVQPATFDGPRNWSQEVHELVEKCLSRIAPAMKAYGESAPDIKTLRD